MVTPEPITQHSIFPFGWIGEKAKALANHRAPFLTVARAVLSVSQAVDGNRGNPRTNHTVMYLLLTFYWCTTKTCAL